MCVLIAIQATDPTTTVLSQSQRNGSSDAIYHMPAAEMLSQVTWSNERPAHGAEKDPELPLLELPHREPLRWSHAVTCAVGSVTSQLK